MLIQEGDKMSIKLDKADEDLTKENAINYSLEKRLNIEKRENERNNRQKQLHIQYLRELIQVNQVLTTTMDGYNQED